MLNLLIIQFKFWGADLKNLFSMAMFFHIYVWQWLQEIILITLFMQEESSSMLWNISLLTVLGLFYTRRAELIYYWAWLAGVNLFVAVHTVPYFQFVTKTALITAHWCFPFTTVFLQNVDARYTRNLKETTWDSWLKLAKYIICITRHRAQ